MAGIFGADTTDTIGKVLAGEHMRDDRSIRKVYLVEHQTEVRLIEVTDSVPATGEVLPFRFAPDPPDIPFKSLVVLIHPQDWENREKLQWPAELDPAKNPVELIANADSA